MENHGLQLAEAGFVVVVQSARGRHGSDGRFIAFRDDVEDGEEAITWCANQPWSDGRVFLGGKSYEGFAAWAAASFRPAPLVGLAVSMTASMPVQWFFENGLFRHSFAQSWGLSLAYTDEKLPSADFEIIRNFALDLDSIYSISPTTSPLSYVLPGYLDWISESSLERVGAEFVSGRSVPVHLVSGWNDIFVRGALKDAALMAVDGDRVIIGPWSHDTVGVRVIGQTDYGVEATTGEFDVFADRLRWMGDVLGDGAHGGVKFFSQFNRSWIDSPGWPCQTDAIKVPIRLFQQTSQLENPILTVGSRVVSPGGRLHHPTLPVAGGFKFPDWDPWVYITFRSSPMSDPFQICGPVRVTIRVDGPEKYMLASWIFLEKENGERYSLSTGVKAVIGQPGPHDIEIEFAEVAAFLDRNTSLWVIIAPSAWPEFYWPDEVGGTLTFFCKEECTVTIPVFQDLPSVFST